MDEPKEIRLLVKKIQAELGSSSTDDRLLEEFKFLLADRLNAMGPTYELKYDVVMEDEVIKIVPLDDWTLKFLSNPNLVASIA